MFHLANLSLRFVWPSAQTCWCVWWWFVLGGGKKCTGLCGPVRRVRRKSNLCLWPSWPRYGTEGRTTRNNSFDGDGFVGQGFDLQPGWIIWIVHWSVTWRLPVLIPEIETYLKMSSYLVAYSWIYSCRTRFVKTPDRKYLNLLFFRLRIRI